MSINGIAEVLKSKPSTVRSWISGVNPSEWTMS
jgi:uncharacterized protein YjcR